MPNQNGRNAATPDEYRPSWRPQDENQRGRRSMSDDDDRYWEDRSTRWDRDEGYRSTERYGQGQSGYGAGRYEDDRSYRSRNMGYPAHMEERARERGLDERFSQGRGGASWGEYEGRGGYLGQSGQDMGYGSQQGYGRNEGRWGNEGYVGERGERGRYGASGRWGQHQEGGMYGHGPGSWGQAWRQQPSHRGKGPVGYTRSDERIRELVCEALTDDHYVDATNIEVTVKSGEVILAGTVDERRQKRMAEDIAEQVSGVKDVQNQIRVATERTSSTTSSRESETSTSPMMQDKKHRA